MHSPLVSIVLPVYNGAAHLSKAIQSVISQTYKNWELIIVDDCSSDNSREIAIQFSDKDNRIKIIDHDVNKKLPAALNTGFDQARGVYYTWTSHDNEYFPNALEVLVGFFNDHEEVGLVYANEEKYNIETGESEILNRKPIDFLIHGNTVGACFMYRSYMKELIGGYDEDLFLAEDYDYWVRISKKHKCENLPDVLYRYSVTNTSLTATQRPGVIKATLKMINKNLVQDGGVPKEKEKDFLMGWFKHWFKYAEKKSIGDYKLVWPFIRPIMLKYPFSFFRFIVNKTLRT